MTDREQNGELFERDTFTYPGNSIGASMENSKQLKEASLSRDAAVDDGTGVELEETAGGERTTDPLNPALIRVDTREVPIDLLLSQIRHHELVIPEFHREGATWADVTQSRLIESILIRIPLPVFYIDATNGQKWLVVDGTHRLISLKRFIIDKKLKLCGLEFLTELEGKTYDDLPRNLQRRIAETRVTVHLIEAGTPSAIKYHIFERVNARVGVQLSAQEVRHALNQGKAIVVLVRLANSAEFKQATDHSIRDNRMTDCECVLRFFAFTITPYAEYKAKEFDSFLNDRMVDMNKMPDQELAELELQFKRAMMAAFDIFGRDAFRKRYRAGAARYPINKALFESWSVNLSQLSNEQLKLLEERKDILIGKFIKLMNDPAFDAAVSQGTGDIKKVNRRFSSLEQLIKGVLA